MATKAGKGGYTVAVQNIYSVPPPILPEEHGEVIYSVKATTQGMQGQMYDIDGLAQANAVLNTTNSLVMAQLA